MEGSENPTMVKLISSDHYEFLVDKRCALISGTIRNMLEGSGKKKKASQTGATIHSSTKHSLCDNGFSLF
jgi:hypothetical protein